MTDPYAYWKDALAGKKPEAHIDHPQCGFYRVRNRDKRTGSVTFRPVAYYPAPNGAEIPLCRIGEHNVPELRALETWPWCSHNPITEEAYRLVAENGGCWPDIDPTVAAQLAPIGHNNPPADPLDALKEQIDAVAASVKDYAKIGDDDQLARAQTARSRLLELSRDADKRREDEKKPHDIAAKLVQKKWKPLIDKADEGALAIRTAMNAYATAQQRKTDAAAAEAREAQDKAEKMGQPAAAPMPIPAAPPTKVRGAAGRSAGSKQVSVVREITNWSLCLEYLRMQPDVIDAAMKAAQRMVAAGYDVPGTRIEKETQFK